MILLRDESWIQVLSTETKPTKGVKNKQILLEVDTATWYVFHSATGLWYEQ